MPLAGNRQTHHSRPVSSAHSTSPCSLFCTFSTQATFSPRQAQVAISCSPRAIAHFHMPIGPYRPLTAQSGNSSSRDTFSPLHDFVDVASRLWLHHFSIFSFFNLCSFYSFQNVIYCDRLGTPM